MGAAGNDNRLLKVMDRVEVGHGLVSPWWLVVGRDSQAGFKQDLDA